jgi:hypothetical protein
VEEEEGEEVEVEEEVKVGDPPLLALVHQRLLGLGVRQRWGPLLYLFAESSVRLLPAHQIHPLMFRHYPLRVVLAALIHLA